MYVCVLIPIYFLFPILVKIVDVLLRERCGGKAAIVVQILHRQVARVVGE